MSRRWTLVVAPSAERAIARLPKKVASAVVGFLLGPLCEAPRRVGHPLRGELEGLWSARPGAYRVVFALNQDSHTIEVLRIDHRADVYRT